MERGWLKEMGLRLGGAEGVTGVEVEAASSSPSPMVDQRSGEV